MRKQQKETRTAIDALDLGRLDLHFLDIPLYSFNYQIEKGRREKRQKQETKRRKKKMEESGTSSGQPMGGSCSCAQAPCPTSTTLR
jgi:hypothetical protein